MEKGKKQKHFQNSSPLSRKPCHKYSHGKKKRKLLKN